MHLLLSWSRTRRRSWSIFSLLLPLLLLAGLFPTARVKLVAAASANIAFKTPVKLVQGSDPERDPNGFNRPTSIAYFQNRLYVATYPGTIWIYTLNAAGTRIESTKTRQITAVAKTPNYNEDGSLAASKWQGRRLTLGITVDPNSTSDRVVLYVSHSDPRWGGTDGVRTEIDSDSGMITRLTVPVSAFADKAPRNIDSLVNIHHAVVGLPRSGENHATNGIVLGSDGWLYLAQGSNTNAGTPGSAFGNRAETPLTAAVLRARVTDAFFQTGSLDVSSIQTMADLGRPEFAGRFELFASGYRNPYDLVYHSNGKIYLNNNGPNAGMGTTPGAALGCNTPSFDTGTIGDGLHLAVKGAYGGHPTPIRGECVLNGGNPTRSADPFEMLKYPVGTAPEPAFLAPLIEYGDPGRATLGIAEYSSNAFNGAMKGNLITANFGGPRYVSRIPLGPDGKPTVAQPIKIGGGMGKLTDVAVSPNGVIYVASLQAPLNDPTGAGNALYVIEPTVLGTECPLAGDPARNDSDSDGYTDYDEQLSATDPCNAADEPEDADGDRIGDLLDPDDDNDGIADTEDQLLYDPSNGSDAVRPQLIDWFPTTSYGGIKQSGMLGALINACGAGGSGGCQTPRLDPIDISVGGASGLLGIPARAGSVRGSANNHGNVLLVGLDGTRSFSLTARISAEFFDASLEGRQGALLFGLDADNYVSVALGNLNGKTGIETGIELAGIYTATTTPRGGSAFALDADASTPPGTVDLLIGGDVQRKELTLAYRLDDGLPRALAVVGAAQYPALAGFFSKGRPKTSGKPAVNGPVVGLLASKSPGDDTTVQIGFDALMISDLQGPSAFDPASIVLDSSNRAAQPGTPIELRANVLSSLGDPVPDGTLVTFHTSHGKFDNGEQTIAVRTVEGEARASFSANTPGIARLSVEAGEASAEGTVNFVRRDAATLILSTDTPSVTISSAAVISAEVRDAQGQPVPDGTAIVLTTTLGSFNNDQVQITALTRDGIIEVSLTATTPGVAEISASSGSASDWLQVSFNQPPAENPPPDEPAIVWQHHLPLIVSAKDVIPSSELRETNYE